MATAPLYPAYLPVRPEGYTLAKAHPAFDATEPGLRADPAKPELLLGKGTTTFAVTPAIGTELRGVQLSQLSPAGLDQVALLSAERGVLVFVSPSACGVSCGRCWFGGTLSESA